jgi:hypothetical protein
MRGKRPAFSIKSCNPAGSSFADTAINWKRNLTITWKGYFLTGTALSLMMPFIPLYVEQLGVTGHPVNSCPGRGNTLTHCQLPSID